MPSYYGFPILLQATILEAKGIALGQPETDKESGLLSPGPPGQASSNRKEARRRPP